ncbi:MAG: serine/threonine-protein kinase [Acidobacteria bacterium]|nr:serine/threonine-protein kinase [Acidobacteriota bacterium]MCA1612266.1 serine/threonine-protein kinase [Acidobacteriota bacterium]
MSLSSGARLGPYEILASIGAGGMGEVYTARDTRLERTVAIKVLPAHLSDSAEVRQRFEREAKTISQLSHPHICAIYDVGREGETEYLVMEYIEGQTLFDRLAKGPLPLDQTLRCGVEIADALDGAHRQGIVHRDLKPGNVMLTKSGVKLLDFGLAKVFERQGDAAGRGQTAADQDPMAKNDFTALPTEVGPITEKGTILGTFQYMAPEQLEGKDADARTDIFAFGAVLYEMATGKKAFSALSQASLISAIMTADPPPVSSIQPLSPPVLDRVIRKSLAKDPDERWQNAADLGSELEWISEERGLAASAAIPAATGWRRREGVLLGIAVLLAAGSLALLVLRRPAAQPPREVRFTIPVPEGTVFGTFTEAGAVAVSPDGRRLAFTAIPPGGRSALWVRDLDALAARALPGTEGAGLPFWSPDGRSLGFFAGGKLERIDVAGGPPQTLCDAPYGRGGAWSPGGTILFSAGEDAPLFRLRAAGGAPAPETTLGAGQLGHAWPSFLPDGRHYIFLVESAEGSMAEIHTAILGEKGSKRLAPVESRAIYASPGYLLFVREGTLVAQGFDAGGLELRGDPISIAERIGRTGGAAQSWYAPISASSNGVLAYGTVAAIRNQLLWLDRRGEAQSTVGPPGDYADPDLSPDGKRLAVCRDDPKTGTPDVWLIELARGTLSRFTFDPRHDIYPVWSPDGTRLAFASSREGKNSVYLKAAGSGAGELLLKMPNHANPLDWSADGRLLVIGVFDPKTNADLWMLPLEGPRTPKPLLQSPFNEWEARISPDGRFLAYTSDESGKPEVYVGPLPSMAEKWQVSTEGGTKPTWRRDGREMFYLAVDRKLMSVEVKAGAGFEISAPRALFQTRTPSAKFPSFRSLYAVAPDAQRFLAVSEPEAPSSPPITVVLDWTAGLKKP